MRSDALGLLWEDMPQTIRGNKETTNRPIPATPDTGWVAPTDLPNLKHAKVLGIDCETKDINLKEKGPGWGRKDGHIVGVSLAVDERNKWYLPVRHTIDPDQNMDPDMVFRYLRDLLQEPMPKVGANILYDIGWLSEEDILVKGRLYDVLYAEAILYDTAKRYDLDSTALRWLGETKFDEELYKWSQKAYGGKAGRKQAANIWRCPPALVGPYAEADAWLPIKIMEKQWKALNDNNLMQIFDLECRLIPVLLGMRQRGVPISLERADEAISYLQTKIDDSQLQLDLAAGFAVDVYKSDSLARAFDSMGYSYPKTAAGAPSFVKDWLAAQDHDLGKIINKVRKYTKAQTFIQSSLLDKQVDGKIYPSFHPLRSEDGGAVSGRYSASNPNGQQVTARDKELAPIVRGIFVPEPGYPLWMKQDLSQIEYRFFAHYSGDKRLIAEYQKKDTDYHEVVSAFLGHLMPRKPVKNFNFMSLYGGGKGKVIKMLKAEFNKEQAETLLMDLIGAIPEGDVFTRLAEVFILMYQENFPAAQESLQRDLDIAETTGEIRTILGRRSTFDLWEAKNRRRSVAMDHQAAAEEYGYNNVKRAYCFRALNRRLQGSSADLLKKGMLDAYEQGVFQEIGFPHLTVHDELDNSYHPDLREGFLKLQNCIETAIPMRVPILLGAEVGPNWGDVKEIDLNVINTYP